MPDAIGRYQIVKEIGSGGMGVVYAAHDPQLDRQIAIKTIAMRNTDRFITAGGERLLGVS